MLTLLASDQIMVASEQDVFVDLSTWLKGQSEVVSDFLDGAWAQPAAQKFLGHPLRSQDKESRYA